MEIVKLYEDSVLPTRAHEEDAGLDLYAHLGGNNIVLEIKPHTTVKVDTGIAVAIPKGHMGLILPRSGVSTKKSLANINAPGLIDCNYTGPVFVPLHNYSDEVQYVNNEDRIAQLVVAPYTKVELEVVEKLTETERGDGGFGSSGK